MRTTPRYRVIDLGEDRVLRDINDRNEVVGDFTYSSSRGTNDHTFLWANGKFTSLFPDHWYSVHALKISIKRNNPTSFLFCQTILLDGKSDVISVG